VAILSAFCSRRLSDLPDAASWAMEIAIKVSSAWSNVMAVAVPQALQEHCVMTPPWGFPNDDGVAGEED
jgi:hypothetical protein